MAPEARLPPVSWGIAVVGCVLALLCSAVCVWGRVGLQASSSGSALPAERWLYHLHPPERRRRGQNTAPPTARLGGGRALVLRSERACAPTPSQNDPKSRGRGPLNPGSSARQYRPRSAQPVLSGHSRGASAVTSWTCTCSRPKEEVDVGLELGLKTCSLWMLSVSLGRLTL